MLSQLTRQRSAMLLCVACALLPLAPATAQNYALDFNNNRVDMPYIGTGVDFTEISLEAYVYWRGHISTDASGIMEGRGSTLHWQINQNNNVRVRFEGIDQNANAGVQQNEWFHLAATYNRTTSELRMYKNGAVFHTGSGNSNTTTFWTSGDAQFGTSLRSGDRRWNGMLDEIRIWNKARTTVQIQETMGSELFGTEEGLIAYWKLNEGEGTTAFDSGPNGHDATIVGATWTTDAAPVEPLGFAYSPAPAHGATDIPRDVILSWVAGGDAQEHTVYFGADRAAVEAADTANPMGVLVSQSQAATTYSPAGLEYGQTYFWRVDEIGAMPGVAVSKGKVWSFTVEPYAYAIENVTATASSGQAGMGPENTVNGSGLNADNQHATEPTGMWLSDGVQPNWIQFEFDNAYKLEEMLIWNSNQLIEGFIGFGAKDVTVEYSLDGQTWIALEGVPQFGRGNGLATYTANTTVDFGQVMAKYVKLTINATWGGLSQAGLAEVRFLQIPVQAREPIPADGATDVSLAAELNWRPGREATSHEVLLGTDANAVAAGDVPAEIVTEHSFAPAAMSFGTAYYWKVNEIGDAGTYEGDIWSFTSQEFAAIDDFESYTDDEGSRIYEAWIDGLTTGTSGSQVGYDLAPFAEKSIVHGGSQSMPLMYDNSATPFVSEAELDLAPARNWTVNGADTLSLWVQGVPAGYIEDGGTITMSGAGTDIWGNADDFRFAYKTLSGDGSIVVKVESMVNTNVWAKVGVMIRQSLDADSKFVYMIQSYGSGVSMGNRPLVAAACTSTTQAGITAPQWVKLIRKGDVFTAQYSADGVTWTDLKAADGTIATATVNMTNPVYIGLCVTSHNVAATTTAVMSGVNATGNVTGGSWEVLAIGDDPQPANAPGDLYVTIQDSAGKSATATHPTAVTTAAWTEWQIPLSSFTGVNMARVEKLKIGVDSRSSVTKGAGLIYVDDIGYGHPISADD